MTCTTVKRGQIWGHFLNGFEKAFMFTKASFYLIKNTLKRVLSYILTISVFYLNILDVIYSCDAKLNFQHHFSSLQCHIILQKSF